jgi:translin
MDIDVIRNSLFLNVEKVRRVLEEKDVVRESVIKLGRDVVRESGYVITSIHSNRLDDALSHLRAMNDIFAKVWELSSKFPELRYSGLMNNIASEYVEAVVFYSIIAEGKIPSLEDLGVNGVQYIQGLLDVVGELKRFILDSLRDEDLKTSLELFRVAELIYELTKSLDFPEPLLPGIRRKVDVARSVVESLRTLLTDIKSRKELIQVLNECLRVTGKGG